MHTLAAAGLALRAWGVREYAVAAAFAVAFGLLVGLSTVLIPNPVFGREIPTLAWNYPVWIATSALAGLLAATYLRRRTTDDVPGSPGVAPADPVDPVDRADRAGPADRASRLGLTGTVLAWFAVGCPVCNKLALLALGYSGALTWFAPVQPYLAAAALVLTAAALLVRLRGQVLCPAPRS